MFKSVEYVGFDGQPELRAAAERLTAVLSGEMNTWREEVAVGWSPTERESGGVELSLALALPGGVSENRSGVLTAKDVGNDDRAANRCAMVWIDLLGAIAWRVYARVEDSLLETTGV